MASFPQPRPRMKQANPDEALRALQSMDSITNVSGLTDRGLDIAQGYGDFEPSEAELMQAQLRAPMGVSREQIRDASMQKVKQMLGLRAQEHGEKMQLAQEKTRAEAEARAAQNEAIAARQREMAEMQNAERAASREDAQAFSAQQQTERLAAQGQRQPTSRTTLPTEQMDKRLQEARSGYGGAWNRFVRMLPGQFDGGSSTLKGAIESVRLRMGVDPSMANAAFESLNAGQTADAAIAEAEAQGVQLSPQDQSFLRYVLGR